MIHLIAGAFWGERLASLDLFSLMFQASWVVQLVLLLLVAFSVISWAAIVFKWRELRGAEQDDEAFLEVYHEGGGDAALKAAREYDQGALGAVLLAAHAELARIQKYSGASDTLESSQVARVGQRVRWAAANETHRLEARLAFLATTASSTPFIGLFGTVIGIINSFTGIGEAGSASLAVVAPGIAEALIATAIGLFAAIPATIFYNLFLGQLRELHAAIDLFSEELLDDLRRTGGVGG